MCGIAGYISNTRLSENVIDKMISKLEHRGPDSSGIWRDESTNLVFGHKRLSILDLSSAGHQACNLNLADMSLHTMEKFIII